MNARTLLALGALAALALAAPAARAQTAAYTIGDLGNVASPNDPQYSSSATGISDQGLITGTFTASTNPLNYGYVQHAFRYSGIPGAGGKMTDLGATSGGTGPYPSSVGLGINHRGQVAGYTGDGSFSSRAFIYTGTPNVDGHFTLPGQFGGYTGSANAINNAGQFTGTAGTPATSSFGFAGPSHAFIGTVDAQGNLTQRIVDINPAGMPGADSTGNAINAGGQIAGLLRTPAGEQHAFLYSAGTFTDLGTLGGRQLQVSALNDAGQIAVSLVKLVSPTAAETHDFVATVGPGGAVTLTSLGALGTNDYVYGLNNRGQAVGQSNTLNTAKAFLSVGGQMTDLNTLIAPGSGWSLTTANAINDAGQIVGTGTHTVGRVTYTRGFVLNPTGVSAPEPPAALGLTLGALTLGALCVRARRRSAA